MAWNERALFGVKRFLDRFDRLFREHAGQSPESGLQVRAAVNLLGKEVADDTAAFKYNTAIAHMMETLNTLQGLVHSGDDQSEQIADRELQLLAQILAPYAPFTAERCWQSAAGDDSVHNTAWPAYDPDLEMVEAVTIAIQVRGTVEVPHQAAESEIRHLAESEPGIVKFLSQGEVTNIVYVPMKIINFVVK